MSRYGDEQPSHYLRMLTGIDTLGTHWISAGGAATAAANAALHAGSFFAVPTTNAVTLPGTNGAGYRPARGVAVGVHFVSRSADVLSVNIWDEKQEPGCLLLQRFSSWMPIRCVGVRDLLNGWPNNTHLLVGFSSRGYQPPVWE